MLVCKTFIYMASRTQKSILNAQVSLFYYFIQLLLGFWSRKVFFDYLGSELLGLDTTAANLLGMLNLAEMGVGASVAYFLYKPLLEGDTKTINRIVALQGWIYKRIAIVIILVAMVMLLFFPAIFAEADVPIWCPYATFIVMLYGSLLGYFINFKQIVLYADQKGYKVSRVTQGASIAFKIVVLLIMPYTEYPFIWYLAMNFFGSTFGCLWLNHILKKEYPWLTINGINGREVLTEMPDIMKKTAQVFVHNVSGMIFMQVCPLLMYKFTSLTVIAYYGNYLLIVGKIGAIISMVFGSTGAAVGNLLAGEDKNRIIKVFWELIDSRLCISWIGLFAIYFLVQPFIVVWLGDRYLLSNTIVAMLIIQQAIHMNRSTVDSFLSGRGLFRDVWAPIAEGGVLLILALVLGDYLGIEGVLLSIIIAQTIFVGVWKPYFLFTQGFEISSLQYFIPFAKRIIVIFLSSLLFYYLFGLYDISRIDSYIDWGLHAILVFSFISIVLCVLFYVFTQGMRDFTYRIKNIILERIQKKETNN